MFEHWAQSAGKQSSTGKQFEPAGGRLKHSMKNGIQTNMQYVALRTAATYPIKKKLVLTMHHHTATLLHWTADEWQKWAQTFFKLKIDGE